MTAMNTHDDPPRRARAAVARVRRPAGGGLHATLHTDATNNDARRKLLADYCRQLSVVLNGSGAVMRAAATSDTSLTALAPRLQQTLVRLLAGDSEKQIAHKLNLSRNTVHTYVKSLYRHFDVNSRGELLARFVNAPALPKSGLSTKSGHSPE
jgi:DNA-binding CsgD family transcriptional regulator